MFQLKLGLVLACLMALVACQKEETTSEQQLPQNPVVGNTTSDGDSNEWIKSRSDTNCECEYRIVSLTSSSLTGLKFYLLGSEECSTSCYNMSAYNDTCQDITGTGCDHLVSAPYPTSYILFNCSTAPFSSFNVNYFPVSDCLGQNGFPYASSITFQLRCKEKPIGDCSAGQYLYSNSYTINAAAYSGGTAEVNMVECGCEALITAP